MSEQICAQAAEASIRRSEVDVVPLLRPRPASLLTPYSAEFSLKSSLAGRGRTEGGLDPDWGQGCKSSQPHLKQG